MDVPIPRNCACRRDSVNSLIFRAQHRGKQHGARLNVTKCAVAAGSTKGRVYLAK